MFFAKFALTSTLSVFTQAGRVLRCQEVAHFFMKNRHEWSGLVTRNRRTFILVLLRTNVYFILRPWDCSLGIISLLFPSKTQFLFTSYYSTELLK